MSPLYIWGKQQEKKSVMVSLTNGIPSVGSFMRHHVIHKRTDFAPQMIPGQYDTSYRLLPVFFLVKREDMLTWSKGLGSSFTKGMFNYLPQTVPAQGVRSSASYLGNMSHDIQRRQWLGFFRENRATRICIESKRFIIKNQLKWSWRWASLKICRVSQQARGYGESMVHAARQKMIRPSYVGRLKG